MFGGTDGLRGRRILVVEDESVILLMIEDILAGLGCEVAGAAMRVEAAIAILARGIPFAFLTGYGGRHRARASRPAGAVQADG